MCNRGKRFDINNIPGRIADCFAKQGLGIFINQGFQTGMIITGGEAGFDTLGGQRMCKQIIGAAIQLGCTDNIAANPGYCLNRISDCGHTGG